jgi:arylformamidase
MFYDITRTVRAATAVWPGDTRYTVAHNLRLVVGDSVNLTTITFSPHTGTHADAYYHFAADGAHPAAMPLEPYVGPARVVTVTKPDGPLLPDDLPDVGGVRRLLIHSHVSELDDEQWPERFPYLSVALIERLAGQGVMLVGLDSPSVDAFDSADLPCHHALRRHGMVNLENLCLHDVADGDYELIALPLKLDAVCGSPVRAVLRR